MHWKMTKRATIAPGSSVAARKVPLPHGNCRHHTRSTAAARELLPMHWKMTEGATTAPGSATAAQEVLPSNEKLHLYTGSAAAALEVDRRCRRCTRKAGKRKALHLLCRCRCHPGNALTTRNSATIARKAQLMHRKCRHHRKSAASTWEVSLHGKGCLHIGSSLAIRKVPPMYRKLTESASATLVSAVAT